MSVSQYAGLLGRVTATSFSSAVVACVDDAAAAAAAPAAPAAVEVARASRAANLFGWGTRGRN